MSLDRDWMPPNPSARLGADFSAVRAHAGREAHLGVGSLSLGVSTLEGFGFNSFALTPEHGRDLAEVAERLTMLLGSTPGGHVTVTGHADHAGGEDAAVGRRRAEATRDALVGAGVPATAIEVAEDGVPAVMKRASDPRNRRVDVRFNGGLVQPGPGGGRLGGAGLRLDPAPLVNLTPKPGPLNPALLPPFTPSRRPAPKRAAPVADLDSPKARTAGPGDALKALLKIPAVENWIERVKDEKAHELKALPTGDKFILATAGVSMATLAAAGISTDPAATKFVLGALHGAELEVPGAPWLKVKAITPGGSVGAGLTLELSHFVKELR